MKKKLWLSILLGLLLSMLSLNIVFADTVDKAKIEMYGDTTFPNDCYYFVSATQYVYKDANGDCSDVRDLSGLEKEVKLAFYKKFMDSAKGEFRDTAIFTNIKYEGATLDKEDPLKKQNIISNCTGEDGEEGFFSIVVSNHTYKFFLPYGSYEDYDKNGNIVWKNKANHPSDQLYQTEGKLLNNSTSGITAIIRGVKEGVIAGSVGAGFNIGTVYGEQQKPLKDVMESTNGNSSSTTPTTPTTPAAGTTTPAGQFFRFKSDYTLVATMDYFLSPIFGKILVEDIPATNDEWDDKISELDAFIEGKAIKINQGYLDFINGTSPDRASIQEVGNLDFTNGVPAYDDGNGIKSDEPKKFVNYNMRIAVPFMFEIYNGTQYRLKADGLSIIPNVRMSLYNDTIYQEDEQGVITKLCTNADIQLDRSYLVFFNQKVNGVPVGVVVVLKYNEAVMDTRDKKLYITGRKTAFGGNYSGSLKLDVLNRDTLYFETKTSGKQAILPQCFAFLPPEVGDTATYTAPASHVEIKDTPTNFVVFIDFKEIFARNASTPTPAATPTPNGATNTPKGAYMFVMIRNNSFINEGQLLNWLASDEAKAMPYVEADTLRQKIRGEFNIKSPLNYSDWKSMQDIKAELERDRNGFVPNLVRVISLIFGAFLIVLAMLFILAYWFDIFNTFMDFSILHTISARNMYPVADEESIRYVSHLQGKTKFVTFKDVVVVSIVCLLIGVLFLNFTPILKLFVTLYMYFMHLLGGK